MQYFWACFLVGMGVASAAPVTVCETAAGTVTVIRLSDRVIESETPDQTKSRRLADTFSGRPDIDPADCFETDDTDLPTTRREAWTVKNKKVVIDATIPDPQDAKDAQTERVKTKLGLTDAELAELKAVVR